MELGNTQIGRDTLYKKKQSEVPKQVAQGQTQQKGGYGEELRRQLETIGDVRREKPIIKAKRVDPVVSDPEQYTEDAIKTALEKLEKFILGRGLGGEDKPGDFEQTTPFSGGGGGGVNKNFFGGSTPFDRMTTQQLVDRDNRMYGNTFPKGSFGSGSKETIDSSPGSAVDTNIERHSEGRPEDQPPTVKFEKTKYGQGGLPLGTTTQRQGGEYGIKGDGPAVNASGFQQKNVRGSTSFGGTGKDESARPKQTVAALPSNYKATEKAAFDAAKAYKASKADSKAKGDAAAKATNTPSKPPAGSFGISAAGKKQAEANKAEKNKATPAQKTAIKKSTTVKKSSPSTTKSSTSTSKSGSKRSSRGAKSGGSKSGGSKSGGSKSGGSKSGGSKSAGSKKSSRGAKGSSSSRSKGGTSKGTSRRSNTRRSRRRCDIRCKFDISILTNQNLIRDDLADVAYFVKDLQEIN